MCCGVRCEPRCRVQQPIGAPVCCVGSGVWSVRCLPCAGPVVLEPRPSQGHRTEPDSGIRAWLCLGLCQQFSLRGLPVVLEEIGRGYDQLVASLEEEVLPVAELLGVELPEAAA